MKSMNELDIRGRIYGTVDVETSQLAANILLQAHWAVRKAGHYEFEVRSDDAEIYIEGRAPVLIHGPAGDAVRLARRLCETFSSANIACSFEVYESKTLIDTIKNGK